MRQTAAPLSRRPSLRLKSILLHVTIIFFCLIVVLPIAWVLLLLFAWHRVATWRQQANRKRQWSTPYGLV
jgi:ABC-type sulfate transport system permease component